MHTAVVRKGFYIVICPHQVYKVGSRRLSRLSVWLIKNGLRPTVKKYSEYRSVFPGFGDYRSDPFTLSPDNTVYTDVNHCGYDQHTCH